MVFGRGRKLAEQKDDLANNVHLFGNQGIFTQEQVDGFIERVDNIGWWSGIGKLNALSKEILTAAKGELIRVVGLDLTCSTNPDYLAVVKPIEDLTNFDDLKNNVPLTLGGLKDYLKTQLDYFATELPLVAADVTAIQQRIDSATTFTGYLEARQEVIDSAKKAATEKLLLYDSDADSLKAEIDVADSTYKVREVVETKVIPYVAEKTEEYEAAAAQATRINSQFGLSGTRPMGNPLLLIRDILNPVGAAVRLGTGKAVGTLDRYDKMGRGTKMVAKLGLGVVGGFVVGTAVSNLAAIYTPYAFIGSAIGTGIFAFSVLDAIARWNVFRRTNKLMSKGLKQEDYSMLAKALAERLTITAHVTRKPITPEDILDASEIIANRCSVTRAEALSELTTEINRSLIRAKKWRIAKNFVAVMAGVLLFAFGSMARAEAAPASSASPSPPILDSTESQALAAQVKEGVTVKQALQAANLNYDHSTITSEMQRFIVQDSHGHDAVFTAESAARFKNALENGAVSDHIELVNNGEIQIPAGELATFKQNAADGWTAFKQAGSDGSIGEVDKYQQAKNSLNDAIAAAAQPPAPVQPSTSQPGAARPPAASPAPRGGLRLPWAGLRGLRR